MPANKDFLEDNPLNKINAQKKETSSPFREVLRSRNFRLLWVGEGISLLGDQFFFIALPWLVLQLTGDAFAVGAVLAIAGIPRALFMLVGGALIDRYSPRMTMLVSNLFRMALVALLTFLVLTGTIELWMIYALSLIFGIADAFFFPAQSAIVPLLVKKEHLQIGNSIIQGTAQLSLFAGPLLAGSLIALFSSESLQIQGTEGAIPGTRGVGIAFGVDTFTFLVSAITLWLMRTQKTQKKAEKESVLSSITAGIKSVWNDATLRTFFIIIAAIHILVNGPLFIGIPVLADTRFAEGAAALGIVFSAYGGGSLLGTILAGVLPRPSPKRMGSSLLVIISLLGIGVVLLGFARSTTLAALISAIMGVANGYVVILFVTWLQIRTPQEMLGRMMSLLMFAALGLNPIAMSIAGAFIKLNLTATFVVMGSLLTAITLLSALNPAVRAMGVEPAKTPKPT